MGIETAIHIAAGVAAIFGFGFALAWYLGVVEVCWWPVLSDLREWSHTLERDNKNLLKEHERVVRENHHLRKLVRIDDVAQRTTYAMLEAAGDERRKIERQRLDQ